MTMAGRSGRSPSPWGSCKSRRSGAAVMWRRARSARGVRSFGARFVHNVVNNSVGPAVSVHAYAPPLPEMRRYELTAYGLRYVSTEPAEVNP